MLEIHCKRDGIPSCKRQKFWFMGTLVVGCVWLLLTACGAVPGIGFKENQVLKTGNHYATKEQACILLSGLRKKYESMFGNEAWTKKFGDSTLEQYIQEQVKTQLVQLSSMNLMAEERNITLDTKEKRRAEKAAKEFSGRFTKDQMKKIGFDKVDVENLYQQYALAEKVYHTVTEDVDAEISDDQARMIDVQVILLKTVSGDDGQELSQEERNTINLRAYQIWEKANAGESFEALASQYNEGSQLEYHIGRGEMDSAFDEAAFNLASGQISGLVEGEDGLYIIKCISNYNQAETDANKVRIYEEQCAERFNQEYDKFMKNTEVKLNDQAWKEVKLAKVELPEADFVQIYKSTE